MVFASSLNSIGAGALVSHDDSKLYNTDKEKTLLCPKNEYYQKLAQECIQQRVCVDLFYAMN